jgi:hypothetical protein
MAQGNKMGPMNEGPMTGRKLGYCTGNNIPGCENDSETRLYRNRNGRGGRGLGVARRFGSGKGRGLGFKNRQFEDSFFNLENRIIELENKLKNK